MMRDLIVRLEAATGPDRELDGAVWCAAYGYHDLGWDGAGQRYEAPATGMGMLHQYARDIRPYTASLDAALTLVPEGSSWSVGNNSGAIVVCNGGISSGAWGYVDGSDAKSPALALCIAALRAREAQA